MDDIVKRVAKSDKLDNGAKYTADALDSVITDLQEKGYELLPISQLVYKDKWRMEHKFREHRK